MLRGCTAKVTNIVRCHLPEEHVGYVGYFRRTYIDKVMCGQGVLIGRGSGVCCRHLPEEHVAYVGHFCDLIDWKQRTKPPTHREGYRDK